MQLSSSLCISTHYKTPQDNLQGQVDTYLIGPHLLTGQWAIFALHFNFIKHPHLLHLDPSLMKYSQDLQISNLACAISLSAINIKIVHNQGMHPKI